MTIDVDSIEAIDVHVHAEVGRAGEDGLRPEWRAAAAAYFGDHSLPTAEDVAAYYRERKLAAVVFTVDAETVTGRRAVPNEEVAEIAAANPDVIAQGSAGLRSSNNPIKTAWLERLRARRQGQDPAAPEKK